MPKALKNGSTPAQKQSRPKQPRLSPDDTLALRDFVTRTLSQPPIGGQNPLSIAELIEADPDSYRNAVDLLSQGQSPKAVSVTTAIPLPTVCAMSHFIPDYRVVVKDATARNLSQASLRMSEILVDRADQMPIDRIPFALAVTTEKSELLSGGVTARTEHHHVPTPEELQAMFDSLPSAKAKVLDAKLVELPSSSPDGQNLPPAA
jgi:hypothetical protein